MYVRLSVSVLKAFGDEVTRRCFVCCRYQEYVEKAKSVVKNLDSRKQPPTPEVQTLKNQLKDKEKMIQQLEVTQPPKVTSTAIVSKTIDSTKI